MANVNELKKELSKLSGVDFFNPKYRNVFKKYMTTETEEVEKDTNEEERLRNILGEEKDTEVREEKTTTEEKVEDNEEKEEVKTKEEIVEESNEDEAEDIESDDTDEVEDDDIDDEDLEDDDNEEDFDEFEDKEDNSDTDTTDDESIEEDTADEVVDEEIETKEEYHEEEPAYNKELIDTKVELGLVRAGVRDDRLEDARKLFMADFKGMEDLEHLGEFIKKYPEWIKNGVHNSKAFGMPTNDMGDGYTEEEKKLRSMGINPR